MNLREFLCLAALGLGVTLSTSSTLSAQEDKGNKGEVTEAQQGEAGNVEKTHETNTGEAKNKKRKKPENKVVGAGARNKDCLKAVAQEVNRYTDQRARLKRGREVAKKKNDEGLKKKCNDLEPKIEAKHKKEMDKLRKKYGEKEVQACIETLENERKRGKDSKTNRLGKKKDKNQRKREKAKDGEGQDGDGHDDHEEDEDEGEGGDDE